MLINLTPKSIAEFGTIEPKGMSAATGSLGVSLIKNRLTDKTSFRSLYIHDTKRTALDKIDGTAILFCGKSPNALHTFLLDKTVLLNPGVYYYVLPLIGTAQIAVCAPEGTRVQTIDKQDRPLSIMPVIEPSEVLTLLYHEKERGFSFKGEKHDFWELTYVERGTLHNVVDGKDYEQSQGEIMLFLPNQFHSQYADRDQRVFYSTIGFSMNFNEPDTLNGHIFKADFDTRALFRQIFEERDFGRIYSDDLILCYLKQLIIRLLRSRQVESVLRSAASETRPLLENTIVTAAEEYVRHHLHERLTVSEIAESIPVSETYLSALFKRNTGDSLNHYINTQKMQLARDYILSGQYSITQIAQMLGFSTIHYFSQSFKRHVGMTPTEYANSYKGASV